MFFGSTIVNVYKAVAHRERRFTYVRYTVGYRHTREFGAISECPFAYACYAVAYRHAYEAGTIVE